MLVDDFAAYSFGIDENNFYIVFRNIHTGSTIPTLTTVHEDGSITRKFVLIPEIYFHFTYLLEKYGAELARKAYNDPDFIALVSSNNIWTPFLAEVQRYIDSDPETSNNRSRLERIFRNY